MERLKQLTPMLQTTDVRKTIEFYTRILGFQVTGVVARGKPRLVHARVRGCSSSCS